MIEYLTLSVILLFLAAKKKTPTFGQLTIDGQLALDWLKNGLEIVPRKIEFGFVTAFVDKWNIPDWADGIIAIIHPLNDGDRPVLVTQKSALRILEAKCAEWEADGARCDMTKTKAGPIHWIDFGDHEMQLSFRRSGQKKFDPYIVDIKE